jgi:hypothetical protein
MGAPPEWALEMTAGRLSNGYRDAGPVTIRKVAQILGAKPREILKTNIQGGRE